MVSENQLTRQLPWHEGAAQLHQEHPGQRPKLTEGTGGSFPLGFSEPHLHYAAPKPAAADQSLPPKMHSGTQNANCQQMRNSGWG